MKCPDCDAAVKDGCRFCTQCGVPLFPFCVHCYTVINDTDLFCGGCGKQLSPAGKHLAANLATAAECAVAAVTDNPPYESERKNVTVLFADISGFTAMSEMLDPEDVTHIMNDCLKLMADIVIRYEGYVDKFIGDCTMAIFGAPVTHENDPELAVRAALEMRKAIEGYNDELEITLDQPLTVHIGINSGIVIAGGMGCDKKMEYTVMGDTVNLASRLESIAGNGQIFVSAYTYNLTRNLFDYQALDAIRVKGKREPVTVYEVLHEKSADELRNKSIDTSVPLVGRTQELDILRECTNRFMNGHGQVVFLVSNIGIGKSRIQIEMKKHFEADKVQLIEGVCHSFGHAVSYAVFSDMFKQLLGIEAEDVNGLMISKISENIPLLLNQDKAILTQPMREAVVFIGMMIGLAFGEHFDIPLDQMAAQDIKFGIFRAVGWFFKQFTLRKPVVLIFENLHHADHASVEMLTYLLETLKDDQIFMLFLMRPLKDHPSSKLPLIARKLLAEDSTDITCNNLTRSECEEFICYLLKVNRLPPSVLDLIWNKSEGNPLFIEEMVSSLVDQHYIDVDNKGSVSLIKNLQDISIPGSIQGFIVARVDKLSQELKGILHLAAVIGPVFKFGLLKNVVQAAEYTLNVDESLRRLAESGLIFESSAYPEVEFSFRNPLIQEAVYSTLLHSKRITLHGIVAREIERLNADRLDEQVEILAHHFQQAQSFQQAYDYALKSGLKAKAIYANQDAANYLTQAVRLAVEYDEIAADALNEVYIALAEVYELMGRMDVAIEAMEKAMAVTDGALKQADVLRNIGRLYEKQGTRERAIEIYDEAAQLLRGFPDTAEQGMLLMNQSWIMNRQHNSEAAVAQADRALKIFENHGEQDKIAHVCNNLAVIYEGRGELDKAVEFNLRSLTIFRELGNQRQEANVLLSLGLVHNKKQAFQSALDFYEKALAIKRKIGNRYGIGSTLLARGRCYMDMGRYDAALHVLRQALKVHEDLKLRRKILSNCLSISKVLLHLGDTDTLNQYLKKAKRIAREDRFISELAQINHFEARLAARAGLPADDKLLEAIALYRQIGRERDARELEAQLSDG